MQTKMLLQAAAARSMGWGRGRGAPGTGGGRGVTLGQPFVGGGGGGVLCDSTPSGFTHLARHGTDPKKQLSSKAFHLAAPCCFEAVGTRTHEQAI